ncbi:unnamed protein product [Spirodela intermedia]|uniref:Uncharacterized protein n=1 Tax=Spirodela intermedia TaxID=51605 RepID=A0A7I8J3D1_SPIIN|nr:unnamed protein product [Spirodela intermedia]CAA6664482.1 unnamed protein product [Spirodela intermedia]
MDNNPRPLPVRFLEPGASTASTELLRLAAAGIGDKKSTVVPNEDILDLLLRLLVDVLLIEGDQSLGDALADGVDPGDVTTALHANAHIDASKPVATEEEDGLISLVTEDLRLHQLDGATIDLDQPAAALAVRDRHRILLPPKALHGLHRRSRHGFSL